MIILKLFLAGGLLMGSLISAHALTGNNCAKKYNDCRNDLANMFDKKSCMKKRAKCDFEVQQAEKSSAQNATKNRMLNGQTEPQNTMRPWKSDERDPNSIEVRKEAARRRVLDRDREKAQGPQNNNMRDRINSN